MPFEIELQSMKANPCLPKEPLSKEAWELTAPNRAPNTIGKELPRLSPATNGSEKDRPAERARIPAPREIKHITTLNTPAIGIYTSATMWAGMDYVTHQWDKTLINNPQAGGMARLWKPFSTVNAEGLAPAVAKYESALAKHLLAGDLLLQNKAALEKTVPALLSVKETVAESFKQFPTSEIYKRQNALFTEARNLVPSRLASAVGNTAEVMNGSKLFAAESPAGKAVLKYAETAAGFANSKLEAHATRAELQAASSQLNMVRNELAETLSKSGFKVVSDGFARGALLSATIASGGYVIDRMLGKNPEVNAVGLLLDGFAVPCLLTSGGRARFAQAMTLFTMSRLYSHMKEKA